MWSVSARRAGLNWWRVLLLAIDLWRGVDPGYVEPAALREERHRVAPYDLLNRVFIDSELPHDGDRLRHLQRIADPQSAALFTSNPIAAVFLDERRHPMLVHLGVR
jgi:hypothetical protein